MIQLLKAIEESRKNFKELKKDGKNPMFKNNFSTITNIFDSCKSALEENGINVSFHTYVDANIQKDILVLTLTHLPSGETKTSELMLIDDKRGAQAVGSAITYHRRYMLQAMLNLEADGETDDDGNQASIANLKLDPKKKGAETFGDVVQDFSYAGEPYRIWTAKDKIETYSELKPWGQRLTKIKKDGNHSDDFEKLNKPEVDRILKEIPDLQDKDQKWKDAFIQGLNSTFYGDQ